MKLHQEYELFLTLKKNPKAFGTLFDNYYQLIFGYIFRRVADYQLARDITAETFLNAFLKINSFKWKGVGFKPWLYRISTNEVNQYFRKKKYSPVYFDQISEKSINQALYIHAEEERKFLESELQANKDFKKIQSQITKLSVKYQEVLALRYFEEQDIQSIAVILKKPEGTIKSLLSRGLEKLRQMLH